MKLFVRLFCALIGVFLFFSAVSCSRAKRGDGTLKVAIPAGSVTLDPRLATDAEGIKITRLISDGLFQIDEKLEVVPNLAESYELLSDRSYRFHIRKGVKFHDGSPLTVQDIIYTYRSIIDGEVQSAYKGAYSRIEKIEIESPHTIRIGLNEPYSPFLTSLVIGIVPQKAAKELGDGFASAPIGTGPYKLIRFVPDSIVELEANEGYYGGAPRTKKLVFDIIKDDNVRILKLIKGDVDLVQNAIPPMLLPKVLESPGIKKEEDTGVAASYLGFNLKDRILAKKDVRKAIAYAIDRDAIISHRYQGLAVKANSILAPSNWAYDKHLSQYEYDPKRAKELLGAAGYPDPDGDGPKKRFELVYKTSTNKERIDIAQMIAHQLGEVGIGVRVEPHEWGKFYSDVKKGNFQIYSLSWSLLTEPDMFYDVCHTSQWAPDGVNRNRYSNPEVDRLLTEGRLTMDREKRREIYAKVQEIVLEDLPYVPLWYEKNVVVYRDDLRGVVLRPDASYRAFVEIEKG